MRARIMKSPNETSSAPAYHPGRLFFLNVLAVASMGMAFGIRSNIAGELKADVFDPIDKLNSAKMLGTALGLPFLGFATTIAIGSPLLDYIGMGRLLRLSSLLFLAGTSIVIGAPHYQHGMALDFAIRAGMLIMGLGWGLVETVVNPMTASIYPQDKTHRLNVLHAWWPGGIIMGGLLGLLLVKLQYNWKVEMGLIMIPAAAYGLFSIGQKFPATERVAAGVPARVMFKEALRPFFIMWFLCMFLTAASELAPGQWVDLALSQTVGMKGILLLIYVSGLMFVMRHFAGPLAHKLSPPGLLWFSCLLASLGLLSLSVANSPITGLLAATVWGVGVCYMWPTMLGAASERFPRGGALLMGLMGTAGTLSIYFFLPVLGGIYDKAKIDKAGGEAAFNALTGDKLTDVLNYAGQHSFRMVAILPAILLLVFGAVWLYDRARGGYRPVKIASEPEGFEGGSVGGEAVRQAPDAP